MLGVHGNGLTVSNIANPDILSCGIDCRVILVLQHLIMMPVTPVSTVIEIFYPQGFAHDYHWTAHALGMRHFAIWNDTCVLSSLSPGGSTFGVVYGVIIN